MSETAPDAGRIRDLASGLRIVLAPNPSAMTHLGTNTYILGDQGRCAVIDPGPDDPGHLQAVLAAIGTAEVSHILVTHSHRDHSAMARRLSRASGAPVLAFGDSGAGRSAAMRRLVAGGLASGGEGVDSDFAPDVLLQDGQTVVGDGWLLRVLHTPGHMGNHICLDWDGALFTGDHLMGWAPSLVSPPDGDLTDFMASCRRLAAAPWQIAYPGHGEPVEDVAGRLAWLIGHRLEREGQILGTLALHPGGLSLPALTALVYTDTPAHLHPAATRNVLAHLIDLIGHKRVVSMGPISDAATFRIPDEIVR